jgi:hypothetical protein
MNQVIIIILWTAFYLLVTIVAIYLSVIQFQKRAKWRRILAEKADAFFNKLF